MNGFNLVGLLNNEKLFTVTNAKMKRLLSILLLLQFMGSVLSQTTISTDVKSNTTWRKSSSPYTITSEVEVWDSATLTIEAGVVVKFKTGKSLSIAGNLVAKGTSADPIVFTSDNSSKAAGDWGGLRFRGSASSTLYGAQLYLKGSILKYCTIEYAGSNQNAAVLLTGAATPYIENCTIKHSNSAGIFGDNLSDTLVIKNSSIINNLCNHNGWRKCAVDIGSQSPFYVLNNQVNSNGGGGIKANFWGYPNFGVIKENTSSRNNGFGIIANNSKIELNTITFNKKYSGWEDAGGIVYDGWNGVGRISKNIIGWNESQYGIMQFSGFDSVFGNQFIENISASNIIRIQELNGVKFVNNTILRNSAPTILAVRSSWNNSNISNLGSNTFERNIASEQVVLVEAGYSGSTATIPLTKSNFYYNTSPTIINNVTNYGDVVDAKNSFWTYTNTDSLDAKIKDYYDSRLYGKVDYSGYKTAPNTSTPLTSPIEFTKEKSGSNVILAWNASVHPDVTGYRILYGSRSNGLFPNSVDAGTSKIQTISNVQLTDTFVVVAYKTSAVKNNTDLYYGLSSGYNYADSIATRTRQNIDSIKVRNDVRPNSLYVSWYSSKSSGVIYNIYKGTSAGSLTKVATVGPPTYPHKYVLDTTVLAGTRYYYQIEMVLTSFPFTSQKSEISSGIPKANGIWYVSTTGNDNSKYGTINEPFKTIRRAHGISSNGDTIILFPGQHKANTQTIINKRIVLASGYLLKKDTQLVYTTIIDASQFIDTANAYIKASNCLIKNITFTGSLGKILEIENTRMTQNLFGNNPVLTIKSTSSQLDSNIIGANGSGLYPVLNCYGKTNIYNNILSKTSQKSGLIRVTTANLTDTVLLRNNAIGLNDGAGACISLEGKQNIYTVVMNNGIIRNPAATAIQINKNTSKSDSIFIVNNTIYGNLSGIRAPSNLSLSLIVQNNIITNSIFKDVWIPDGTFEKNLSIKFLFNILGKTHGAKSLSNITNINYIDTTGSKNNWGRDPGYNNEALGDLRLKSTSFAANNGTQNKNTPKFDMFWMPKAIPIGTNPDLGASENFTGPSPVIKRIIAGADANTVQWNVSNVKGIVKYELYRSIDSFTKTSILVSDNISFADTAFNDTLAITGNKYHYRMKAVFLLNQKSEFGTIGTVTTGKTYVWNKTSDKTKSKSWFTASNWTPERTIRSRGDILQFPAGDYAVLFDQSVDQCNSIIINESANSEIFFNQNSEISIYAHNADASGIPFDLITNNGQLSFSNNKIVSLRARQTNSKLNLNGTTNVNLDSLVIDVLNGLTLNGKLSTTNSIKVKNSGNIELKASSQISCGVNGKIYLFSASNQIITADNCVIKLGNLNTNSFIGLGNLSHSKSNRIIIECNNKSNHQNISSAFNGPKTKLIVNKANGLNVILNDTTEIGTLSIRTGNLSINGKQLTITDSLYNASNSCYLIGGNSLSNRSSQLAIDIKNPRNLSLNFDPDNCVLRRLELSGNDTANLTLTLSNNVKIKGGEDGGTGPGLLTINKNAKLVIPSGTTLRLECDTFNAGLFLGAPAKRAIYCTGTGKFEIKREHYGARGWRLYAHPFSADIDLQEVANDIELIGAGGTTEGFYSNTHTNAAAYWYDYSKADSTATTDPAWQEFTSAKGSTISGNANKWQKNSTLLLFNPGNRRGTGAFDNPASATYEKGKITLSYVLDSTTVHLNDGNKQTISTGTLPSKSKYFFITNPYTTPVKLCRIQGLNSTNVDPYFYYWKQRTSTITDNFAPADWQSEKILNGVALRDSNVSIPAFGTILVRLKNTAATTFTIPESAKQISNYTYIIGGAKGVSSMSTMFADRTLLSNGPNAIEVKLLVKDSWEADRLLLYDEAQQTSNYTTADAKKFINQDFPNVYSLSGDGMPLGLDLRDIQSQLASGKPEVEVPLGIQREFDKRYASLRIQLSENNTAYSIGLKDRQTGITQPLAMDQGIALNFASDTINITRYSLVFKQSTVSTDNFKDQEGSLAQNRKPQLLVYPNPAKDYLNVRMLNSDEAMPFEIYTITGIKVGDGITQNNKKIDIKELPSGLYLLKVKNQQAKFLVPVK